MEIKKVNIDFEIVELDNKKTFTTINNKKKIKIYDENLIEEIISKKFNDQYKRILYIIMDINNSDDATDTDNELVRNYINELRNVLINKYKKYLSKELLNKYLKMLLILESKLVIPEKRKGR